MGEKSEPQGPGLNPPPLAPTRPIFSISVNRYQSSSPTLFKLFSSLKLIIRGGGVRHPFGIPATVFPIYPSILSILFPSIYSSFLSFFFHLSIHPFYPFPIYLSTLYILLFPSIYPPFLSFSHLSIHPFYPFFPIIYPPLSILFPNYLSAMYILRYPVYGCVSTVSVPIYCCVSIYPFIFNVIPAIAVFLSTLFYP